MDAKPHRSRVPVSLSADRIASLSDTMFGVAMTLVVTTLLPAIQAQKGSALHILAAMSGDLVTVVLSFAISARYWVTQQKRLAMTGAVTEFQTALHLVFLFLIVLVPISTSLPGLIGADVTIGSVMIYGGHLCLIAAVNLLLWIEVHRTAVAHLQIVRSALVLAVFVASLAAGMVRPDLALYFWFAALAAPLFAGPIAKRVFGA